MKHFLKQSIAAMALIVGSSGVARAAACDIGTVSTADGKFDVRVRLASPACADEAPGKVERLATGEAVATKIRVSARGKSEPTGDVTVKGIGLQRRDGLPAKSEPGLRQLSEGVYFADNFDFAAGGDWILSLKLGRAQVSETVKFTVPVELNAAQAEAVTANAVKVPDFAFQDTGGKIVKRSDLVGKVWVSNFFFASCPEICPLMSQKLRVIQKQFKDARDFRIVSVSTDPENDSAPVLKDYAKRYKAETGRWYFLRGPKTAVVALSDGGLSLDVTLESPMHSTRFALVDRDGTIRGRYDSTKIEELEQLKVAIRDLLVNKGDGT